MLLGPFKLTNPAIGLNKKPKAQIKFVIFIFGWTQSFATSNLKNDQIEFY